MSVRDVCPHGSVDAGNAASIEFHRGESYTYLSPSNASVLAELRFFLTWAVTVETLDSPAVNCEDVGGSMWRPPKTEFFPAFKQVLGLAENGRVRNAEARIPLQTGSAQRTACRV